MPETPAVLIVGAGAVGQAYARHLQLGGASVSFLVKPKYKAECQAGLTLYPYNDRAALRAGVRLLPERVFDSPASVAGHRFDQVWLCVASPALRAGLPEELIPHIGDATLVSLTPGLEDRAHLLRLVPESRLVQGLITLIAYQAPIRGESFSPPGIAYWLPPLTPVPFAGPEAAVRPIVALLRRGGMAASVNQTMPEQAAFAAATLNTAIGAFELADWSFAKLRSGSRIDLSIRAAREAWAVVAAEISRRPPFFTWLWRGFVLRLLLRISPWVIPFDIETYLGYHFDKVGEQTRQMIDTWIRLGGKRGVATPALSELAQGLAARPRSASH